VLVRSENTPGIEYTGFSFDLSVFLSVFVLCAFFQRKEDPQKRYTPKGITKIEIVDRSRIVISTSKYIFDT
jgi:hypothetical protein